MKEKFVNIGIVVLVFLLSVGLTLAAISNYVTVSGIATVKQLTTVTLYSTADSFIEEGNPDKNNNNWSYLSVKSLDGGTSHSNFRSLVQFDLSSILSGATITSATLNLYYYYNGVNNPVGRTYWVYRLTDSWIEDEVTWNNRDNLNSWTNSGEDYTFVNGASSTVPPSHGWMSWDVKNIVSDWINGESNNGFLILDGSENSAVSYYTRLYSREFEETVFVPYLTVTYVV